MQIKNQLEPQSFHFTIDKPNMLVRSEEIRNLAEIDGYCKGINETINFAFQRIKKVYYCYLVIILITIPIRFIVVFEKYDFNKAILSLFATIILTPFMIQSAF